MGELKEWGSMRFLTERIPRKAQLQLVHRDLELTCVAALPGWLALGSNVGIVYLHHQLSDLLRRLRISGFDGVVTSVKLVPREGEGILVAAGLDSGKIAFFHVDQSSAASIPDVGTVEAHVTAVTCLEWDAPHLRLYSGDSEGFIQSTSVSSSFKMEVSPVAKEGHAVTQLCCSPNGRLLLVATLQRAALWDVESRTVRQVGRQERKCLEPLGATFQRTEDGLMVYAGRPGLRIWRADSESGQVIETVKFRGVEAAHMVALDATPSAVRNKDAPPSPSLARLEPFGSLVVAWSPAGSVLVLDPYPTPRLAATLPPLWPLSDVAGCGSEIFLLVQPHTLVCLSTAPPPIPRPQLKEAQTVDILQEIWMPLEKLGNMVRGEEGAPRLLGWLRRKSTSSSGEDLPPVKPLDLPPLVLKLPDPLEDRPPIFGLLEEVPCEDVVVHKRKKKKRKKSEGSTSLPLMEASIESVEVLAPRTPDNQVDPEAALDQILAAYDLRKEEENSSEVPDSSPPKPAKEEPPQPPPPKPVLRKKETFDIYSKEMLLSDEPTPPSPEPDQGLGPVQQGLQETDLGYLYRGNWARCMVPGAVTSMALWRDCVACCISRDTLYVCPMGGIGLAWRALRPRREANMVAADGPHLWLLHKGNARYLPDNVVSPSGLNSAKWLPSEADVIWVAVAGDIAWCLKTGGLVVVAHSLPPSPGQAGKVVDLPCVGTKMAANQEGLVWLLGDQGQVFCGRPLAPGAIWTPLRCPAGVRVLALSEDNSGWVLDDFSNLWFTLDIVAGSVWWQVEMGEPQFQDDSPRLRAPSLGKLLSLAPLSSGCLLASDKCGVWLARGSELTVATRRVVGHRWQEVALGGNSILRWQIISAEGLGDDCTGVVWALLGTGALFCWSDPAAPRQVQPPDGAAVVGLSATPGVLWLQTSAGQVYIRTGFTEDHPEGTGWAELNLTQLEGESLSCVSCVGTVAWGCTPAGEVYFSLGSSLPPTFHTAPARAWVLVSSQPSMAQVALGRWHQVWGLDSSGAVWARGGVTPDFPLGTEWVKIPGLGSVTQLSAGRDVVWVYGPDGAHVRCGTAPWGDYWQHVPCPHLHSLSAGGDHEAWGLTQDLHSLVKLQSKHLQLSPDSAKLTEPSTPVDDWEVVEV